MGSVETKEFGCLVALFFLVIALVDYGYPWWLVVLYSFYSGLGLLFYLIIWEAISNDNNQK